MKQILLMLSFAAMTAIVKAQPCTAPPPDLVMHWDFNGNTTELVNGWAGNLLFAGTPTFANYTTGRDGTANGAIHLMNEYLQVPYDNKMDLKSWTITAVIRPNDFYNGDCQGNAVVWRGTQFGSNHYDLQYFDNAFDNDCDRLTGYHPYNNVFAGGAAGTAPFAQSDWLNNPPVNNTAAINPFIVPGQWYCVTLMYDHINGVMELFVDNVRVFSRAWPSSYGAPTMDDLFIGSSDNPSGLYPYFIFADIDDIKIFDGVYTCPIQMFDLCACTQNPWPPAVAHWNFEGATPLVDDVNGLTGVITGGVTAAAGVNGTPNTAYDFNGTSGFITVPHDPVLDLTSWTIRAIIQPQGFYNGICQGNIVVSKGVQMTGNNYYSLLFTDNAFDNNNCNTTTGYNPARDVFIANAAGTAAPLPANTWLAGGANPFIVANQWYCVTASYDGAAGRIRLFVDGIAIYDEPWANQYGTPMAPGDLFIGGQNNPTFPYFFNGIIDDIAIYAGATECPMSCTNGINGLAKRPNSVKDITTLEEVSISPNPTTGQIDVTIPVKWRYLSISVINSVGQVVLTESKVKGGKYQLNLNHLPNGMYLLKIDSKDHTNMQKFIKN